MGGGKVGKKHRISSCSLCMSFFIENGAPGTWIERVLLSLLMSKQ